MKKIAFFSLLTMFLVSQLAAQIQDPLGGELGAPQILQANNQPISVDVGHAAPAVFDLNRDGKDDLLVGQFGGGKLRVYLNKGFSDRPEFQDFTFFSIQGQEISVPSG